MSSIKEFLSNISPSVIGSVIAGAILAIIFELIRKAFSRLNRRRFKAVFGQDILQRSEFHLIYAQLGLRPVMDQQGNRVTHPYLKPGEETSGTGFSMERPVSSCEVRAAKYLAEIIGGESGKAPVLSSDYELREHLDISFVSFGGPKSNYKTRDVVGNDGNQLIIFDNYNFFSEASRRLVLRPTPPFDYGIILKIHPIQFPKRVWLICAGIGEWGTSGAAYYLAHKWKEIYSYSKQKQFAMIVRVESNKDESAFPLVRVRSSNEAEEYSDMVEKELSVEGMNNRSRPAQDSTAQDHITISSPSASASDENDVPVQS